MLLTNDTSKIDYVSNKAGDKSTGSFGQKSTSRLRHHTKHISCRFMSQPSQEEVFKNIAIGIAGQWHHFNQVISFTFYPMSLMDESSKVFIARGNRSSTATYRINVTDHKVVRLIIEGDFNPINAVIKELSNNTVILLSELGIEIIHRMPDMEFADRVVEA